MEHVLRLSSMFRSLSSTQYETFCKQNRDMIESAMFNCNLFKLHQISKHKQMQQFQQQLDRTESKIKEVTEADIEEKSNQSVGNLNEIPCYLVSRIASFCTFQQLLLLEKASKNLFIGSRSLEATSAVLLEDDTLSKLSQAKQLKFYQCLRFQNVQKVFVDLRSFKLSGKCKFLLGSKITSMVVNVGDLRQKEVEAFIQRELQHWKCVRSLKSFTLHSRSTYGVHFYYATLFPSLQILNVGALPYCVPASSQTIRVYRQFFGQLKGICCSVKDSYFGIRSSKELHCPQLEAYHHNFANNLEISANSIANLREICVNYDVSDVFKNLHAKTAHLKRLNLQRVNLNFSRQIGYNDSNDIEAILAKCSDGLSHISLGADKASFPRICKILKQCVLQEKAQIIIHFTDDINPDAFIDLMDVLYRKHHNFMVCLQFYGGFASETVIQQRMTDFQENRTGIWWKCDSNMTAVKLKVYRDMEQPFTDDDWLIRCGYCDVVLV